jgi:cytochrome c oxidase assembly protein subunit 15
VSSAEDQGDRFSPALHGFAVFTALCTVALLVAGGLVTSTGSSLAVPDWPLSFGQVLPKMEGGVLYEHGHRMVASFVGLLSVALAVWITRRERRRWVRRLAFAALLAVVLQGVLGGVTVLMRLPLAVSVGHACLGQVFFCLVVTLAVVTGRNWAGAQEAARSDGSFPPLPSLCLASTVMIFIQLVLGALVRHTGSGLAIPDFPLAFGRLVPPVLRGQVLIAYLHRLGALGVILIVSWTAARILRRHAEVAALRRPAVLMLSLLFLQVALGGLTVLSELAVVPATTHVVTGALLLATAWVATLRSFRRIAPRDVTESSIPAGRREGWAVR